MDEILFAADSNTIRPQIAEAPQIGTHKMQTTTMLFGILSMRNPRPLTPDNPPGCCAELQVRRGTYRLTQLVSH